ncbi:cobalt ECF transporter T component CbiQ [Metabacillus bambusae]|uniref:Cobalt ECF transporter T component CbiQ n=1 Tax=Metabacillus bambusae TaxID=2795218 RepID=A0ABS3MZH1_9BACI|nr:cobalt ECF transporter T component CbiQ [Metabacillus bambusae]MBO1511395.1 cobalt ECF transporter T component CbiQ [Metabacillus bambusae]
MLRIDDYAYTNALKHIHPAEKVGFAFSFLLFTIITKNVVISSLTFFVMSISIVLAAKIPLSHYIKLLLLPAVFLCTSIITIMITIAPVNEVRMEQLWSVNLLSWQLYISLASVKQAYHLGATVLASVSCLYFLILTTPLNQLMWVLRKLKLPVLFLDLVGVTYRFIFVLLHKMEEIYLAQSSRLGYQNYRVWLTSSAQLIVSLFIKSIQSARELQIAMESRGGDEGLYDIEITISYNRYRCAGILLALVGLFTITLLT